MRLPYGIYKAAQAEALRARKERATEAMNKMGSNMASNIAQAQEAIAQRYSMKRPRVEGQGAYNLSKFNRDFKSIVPKSIRRQMEHSILQGMQGYEGMGAYSGRGAYNNLIVGGRPSMGFSSDNDETQSITISHCEYLQDVFGAPSAAFTVESWALNPGLTENFPWLSQIAANYEEYEFIQLIFHFKSTVDVNATNNNNGATGTIILATNYNPSAPNFANKEIMMQYHGANSGRVVEDHDHGVECDPDKNAGSAQKYVRSSPAIVGQDPKTFDLGKFQIGQVNIPQAFYNQQIGELWVSYTVKLTKPRLFTSVGSNIPESRYITAQTTNWTMATATGGLLGNSSNNIGTLVLNADGTVNTTSTTWTQATDSAYLLSMQQNFIPVTISMSSRAGVATTTNAATALKFTFPDFLTGVYEIAILVEGTGLAAYTALAWTTEGSAAAFNDMTPSPGAQAISSNNWYGANSSFFTLNMRVALNPITQGVDNNVYLAWQCASLAVSTSVVSVTQIIIRQCNPNLIQSPTNPLPLYVSNLGVVTQPRIV